MEIFAVTCLVIIFIIIQHLLNWGWRKAINSSNIHSVPIMFVMTFFALVFACICLQNIIMWGYPLLTK